MTTTTTTITRTRGRKPKRQPARASTDFMLRLPVGMHQEVLAQVVAENKAKREAGIRTGVAGVPWSNRITMSQWIREAIVARLDQSPLPDAIEP